MVRSNDVWAVGAGGTALRFSPVTLPDSGSSGTGTTSSDGTFTYTVIAGDGNVPETVVIQRPPAGSPKRPAGSPPQRMTRLLRNVKVRVFRGRLVITFRLMARARVAARALRGGRLVGRVGARLMRRGYRKLILHYRGRRPPSQLQLIVRAVPRRSS